MNQLGRVMAAGYAVAAAILVLPATAIRAAGVHSTDRHSGNLFARQLADC